MDNAGYMQIAQSAFSIYSSLRSVKDAKKQADAMLKQAARNREVSTQNTARLLQGRVAEIARLQETLVGIQGQARGFSAQIALNQGLTQNYSSSVQALQADIDRQADRAKQRALRNQEQYDLTLNQRIQAEAQSLIDGTPQIQANIDYSQGFAQAINSALDIYQRSETRNTNPFWRRNDTQLYGKSSGKSFSAGMQGKPTYGSVDLSAALGLK